MEGENSCQVVDCGANPDVVVPLTGHFSPDLPICMRLFLVKTQGSTWKTRVQRLTTISKSFLLVYFSQLLEVESRRASPLKRQLGSGSSFGDRDCFRHGWTTDMLVFT